MNLSRVRAALQLEPARSAAEVTRTQRRAAGLHTAAAAWWTPRASSAPRQQDCLDPARAGSCEDRRRSLPPGPVQHIACDPFLHAATQLLAGRPRRSRPRQAGSVMPQGFGGPARQLLPAGCVNIKHRAPESISCRSVGRSVGRSLQTSTWICGCAKVCCRPNRCREALPVHGQPWRQVP